MKTILLPLDFSDISKQLIDIAEKLASSFSSAIWLIHIIPPDPEFVGYNPGPNTVRKSLAELYSEEHRRLQNISAELRNNGLNAKSLVLQGPIVEKIVSFSKDIEADLIVVGSHRRGSIHKAILGSVCEELLRHASCPLLIVPCHAKKKTP